MLQDYNYVACRNAIRPETFYFFLIYEIFDK